MRSRVARLTLFPHLGLVMACPLHTSTSNPNHARASTSGHAASPTFQTLRPRRRFGRDSTNNALDVALRQTEVHQYIACHSWTSEAPLRRRTKEMLRELANFPNFSHLYFMTRTPPALVANTQVLLCPLRHALGVGYTWSTTNKHESGTGYLGYIAQSCIVVKALARLTRTPCTLPGVGGYPCGARVVDA